MPRKLLLLGLLPMLPVTAVAEGWTFELEPYIMATSISGDASIGRVTGVEVDVDMSDILEKLEMAAMLHFEAHSSGGWGVALDYGFMDLGADISGPLGGVVDADVRQGVLEALVIRRTEKGGGQLDIMGGFRWWDNDIDVRIDPAIWPGTVDFDVKEDWFDLVVGARFTKPISERWKMQLRGDVGGLGLEADFTSTLSAGFRFAMTQSIELDLQYKATWVDYESGSRGDPGYFEYDTVTHGPIIGVNFKF
jgi:opacity protein-like surface antigen